MIKLSLIDIVYLKNVPLLTVVYHVTPIDRTTVRIAGLHGFAREIEVREITDNIVGI